MEGGGGGGIAAILGGLIGLAIVVVVVAGLWKVFTKAGKPGWACLVPLYNIVVLLDIVGKPTWWIVFFFFPPAAAVVNILLMIVLAEKFGKSTGFGLGLAFLGPVFIPMLGFGDAQYQGQG